MDNFLGGLILFGLTAFLFYHCLNGVRHLVWDTGRISRKAGARRAA